MLFGGMFVSRGVTVARGGELASMQLQYQKFPALTFRDHVVFAIYQKI